MILAWWRIIYFIFKFHLTFFLSLSSQCLSLGKSLCCWSYQIYKSKKFVIQHIRLWYGLYIQIHLCNVFSSELDSNIKHVQINLMPSNIACVATLEYLKVINLPSPSSIKISNWIPSSFDIVITTFDTTALI